MTQEGQPSRGCPLCRGRQGKPETGCGRSGGGSTPHPSRLPGSSPDISDLPCCPASQLVGRPGFEGRYVFPVSGPRSSSGHPGSRTARDFMRTAPLTSHTVRLHLNPDPSAGPASVITCHHQCPRQRAGGRIRPPTDRAGLSTRPAPEPARWMAAAAVGLAGTDHPGAVAGPPAAPAAPAGDSPETFSLRTRCGRGV